MGGLPWLWILSCFISLREACKYFRYDITGHLPKILIDELINAGKATVSSAGQRSCTDGMQNSNCKEAWAVRAETDAVAWLKWVFALGHHKEIPHQLQDMTSFLITYRLWRSSVSRYSDTFFVGTMQWIETNIIIICQVFIPCIPIDGVIHMAGPSCKTPCLIYN